MSPPQRLNILIARALILSFNVRRCSYSRWKFISRYETMRGTKWIFSSSLPFDMMKYFVIWLRLNHHWHLQILLQTWNLNFSNLKILSHEDCWKSKNFILANLVFLRKVTSLCRKKSCFTLKVVIAVWFIPSTLIIRVLLTPKFWKL